MINYYIINQLNFKQLTMAIKYTPIIKLNAKIYKRTKI